MEVSSSRPQNTNKKSPSPPIVVVLLHPPFAVLLRSTFAQPTAAVTSILGPKGNVKSCFQSLLSRMIHITPPETNSSHLKHRGWYWDYKCTWVWKICWFNGYPGIQSAQEYHSLSTRSASSRLIHPTQLGFAGISPPLHSSSPWNLALNVVQGNLSTKRHASITSYHVQPKNSAIESLLWRSDEGPSLENGRMSTAQGGNLNDKLWTHTKRYLQAKQIIGPPFN